MNTNPLNHVTQPTSPRAYAGTGTIANPCIPSQRVCALQCAGGYSKGPSGCEFCMCAPSLNFGKLYNVDCNLFSVTFLFRISSLLVIFVNAQAMYDFAIRISL